MLLYALEYLKRGASLLFQWAPTLGGECYKRPPTEQELRVLIGFNGHPPLGVNATFLSPAKARRTRSSSFKGHPPLGVNATGSQP